MRRLAEGELLLHIGPHKTGSTTLQLGFHRNRERLLAQGVHYGGSKSQPMTAAMVAATGTLLSTRAPEAAAAWDELVAEVHEPLGERVVISSEFFCEADAAHAAGILDRLGRDRTQVVITLRPLARILASQWQQFVQNRLTTGYPVWLERILSGPETTETPSFWLRHRHDRLVERWAEVAGPDRVTVVVLEEGDPGALLRTFEQVLALDRGTLDPGDVTANRSLTHPEVELLRHFNLAWRSRGWSESDYTRLVRFGAVRHLQTRRPPADEPRILTPDWAVTRAQQVSAGVVTAVGRAGVDVVGDLHSLTDGLPVHAVGTNEPADPVPADVAARFAAGLALRFGHLAYHPLDPDRRIGDLEAVARRLGAVDAPAVRHRGRRSRPAADASARDLVAALAAAVRRRGSRRP